MPSIREPASKLVIEENTIYEIDLECLACQQDEKTEDDKEEKDI